MVIDGDTHNDARQPNTQRTVPTEPFDTAVTTHQRFLDDVLGVARISSGSDCNLKQKRPVLASSRFEVNVFCPNSRLHPRCICCSDSPNEGEVRIYFLAALMVLRSSNFFFTFATSSDSVANCNDLFHSLRASSYRLVLK